MNFRDEYEAQQQKAMARLSKSHNQLALVSSIEEGMKAQSQLRKLQKVGAGKGAGAQNSSINDSQDAAATADGGNPAAPTGSNSGGTQTNNNNNANHSSSSHPVTNGQAPAPGSSSHANNATPSASANNPLLAGASSSNPSHVGPSPAKISRTDSAGDNSSNTSGFSEEVTEVELVFKPHPDMIKSTGDVGSHNQTRYIKTTANASVSFT